MILNADFELKMYHQSLYLNPIEMLWHDLKPGVIKLSPGGPVS